MFRSPFDLKGAPLRVAANFPLPCCYETAIGGEVKDFLDIARGSEFQFLNFLARHFNFTYTVITANMSYGAKVNGVWNGLVGVINRTEADFALSALSITLPRLEAIDYSIPYKYDPVSFMIPMQYALEREATTVIGPGTLKFVIGLFVCFVGGVLIARYMKRQLKELRTDVLWTLFQNLMQKGLEDDEFPIAVSLRILVVIWVMVGFISISIIAGELLAFLAGAPPDPLSTIKEIANAKNVEPLMIKGSYLRGLFKMFSNQNVQKILSRTRLTNTTDIPEYMNMVFEQKRYFVMALKSRLVCSQKKMNERILFVPPDGAASTFFEDFLALGFQKESNLTRPFNAVIRQLFDTGILDGWQLQSQLQFSNFLASFSYVPDSVGETETVAAVRLGLLVNIFYFLAVGSVVACMTLISECVIFRRQLQHSRVLTRLTKRRLHKRRDGAVGVRKKQHRSKMLP